MNTGVFVPNDGMRGRIKDMLPGRRGSPRRDLPEEFGNWNSVFKRFPRWAWKVVYDLIFKVLSEIFDLDHARLGGIAVQARRKASGGKVGHGSWNRGAGRRQGVRR